MNILSSRYNHISIAAISVARTRKPGLRLLCSSLYTCFGRLVAPAVFVPPVFSRYGESQPLIDSKGLNLGIRAPFMMAGPNSAIAATIISEPTARKNQSTMQMGCRTMGGCFSVFLRRNGETFSANL